MIFDSRPALRRPLKKRHTGHVPVACLPLFSLAATNVYYYYYYYNKKRSSQNYQICLSSRASYDFFSSIKNIKKNYYIMWYKPFFCYNLSLLFSQILSPKTLSFPSTLPILRNDIVSNRHYLSISLCFVLIFKLCFARQFIMRVIMSKKYENMIKE